MQKCNLAHVGMFDTRGWTCEKNSFNEAKRWVTLRYEFLSKKITKKQQKDREKQFTKQKSILQFFRFGTLQNRDSRVGVVTISRTCHENED